MRTHEEAMRKREELEIKIKNTIISCKELSEELLKAIPAVSGLHALLELKTISGAVQSVAYSVHPEVGTVALCIALQAMCEKFMEANEDVKKAFENGTIEKMKKDLGLI